MGDIEKVLVVGGGIGGLSTTVALRRAGVEVDVVEKNPKWDVYGVGIIQPPNALAALHAIGLAEQCIEQGHPIMGGRNYMGDGTLVGENDFPPVVPGWPPMNGITRPALHEILKAAVLSSGAEVHVGETVTDIASRVDGADVSFTDGSSSSYDLVLGIDGLYSDVREMVFGDAVRPRYTGQACFRYNLPRLEGLDRIEVYIGGVAGTAGFVPLSDELMYMLFILKWPEDELRQDPDRLDEVMRRKLEPFGGNIATHRDQIADPEQVVYRPVDNILMPAPWHRGRVLLTRRRGPRHLPPRRPGRRAGHRRRRRARAGDLVRQAERRGARRVHGAALRTLQAGRRAVGRGRRMGAEPGPRRRPQRDPQPPDHDLRTTGMTRIVDLSFVVEASPPDLPQFMRIDIEYSDHASGAAELEQLLDVDRRLLRDAEGPAGERLSIGTHATTHVDAPWHYN